MIMASASSLRLWGVLAVAALLAAPSMAEVSELGDDNFDSQLEGMDTALVMFYAPWCGHCKRLKPEFEKASKTLLSNDPPVNLVKVDCTEAGKDTCGRFEVRGYPTLKIFRSGELSQEYNGPREADGIVKYMKAQVGPASKELKTKAEVTDYLNSKEEVVVVSYLKSQADRDVFGKVASAMRETVAFANLDGQGPEGEDDVVVLYRPKQLQTKLEQAKVTYDGAIAKDKLTTWIKANYHGLVGHRTLDNAGDFKEPLVIAFYGVDYVKNPKGTNYWRNRIMKVAKESGSKLNFAIANKDDFLQEATEFGLTSIPEDKPRVVIREGGKKYVMEEEFSVDSFAAFLKSHADGKVAPYLKSEDVPASNDGPVKVAVAKNFDELVTNTKRDALVEFYAPWCGHCKKLTPVYDELGQKMAGEEVDIVKMDATANDVPSGFDVRGFPTLYWVPAESKKPEPYNGGRELDDFIKFIAKSATKELNGYDRKGKEKKTEL